MSPTLLLLGGLFLAAFAVAIVLLVLLQWLLEPEHTPSFDDPRVDFDAPEYHTQEPLQ